MALRPTKHWFAILRSKANLPRIHRQRQRKGLFHWTSKVCKTWEVLSGVTVLFLQVTNKVPTRRKKSLQWQGMHCLKKQLLLTMVTTAWLCFQIVEPWLKRLLQSCNNWNHERSKMSRVGRTKRNAVSPSLIDPVDTSIMMLKPTQKWAVKSTKDDTFLFWNMKDQAENWGPESGWTNSTILIPFMLLRSPNNSSIRTMKSRINLTLLKCNRKKPFSPQGIQISLGMEIF